MALELGRTAELEMMNVRLVQMSRETYHEVAVLLVGPFDRMEVEAVPSGGRRTGVASAEVVMCPRVREIAGRTP